MFKILKNNKLYGCLIFLLFVSFVFIIAFMQKYNTLWDDDYFFAAYRLNENMFSALDFDSSHGGGYLGLFISRLFSFTIPVALNIHPEDILKFPLGFINGIFGFFTILIIAKFTNFYKKSKMLKISTIIFCICYFLYACIVVEPLLLKINYMYYRYFLSMLFIGFYLCFIFKHMIYKSSINYKQLIFACICAYGAGASVECNFICISCLIGFIIIYNIVFFILEKLNNNKFFLKNIFNLDLNFFIPSGFFFTAMILFINSDSFKGVADDRGLGNYDIYNVTSFLKEFTIDFWNLYIKDNLILHLVLILFILIGLIVAIKCKEVKKIIIPLILYLSILISMYSLIFLGKTCESGGNIDFWLFHNKLKFLYRMLILFPFLMIVSYITNKIYMFCYRTKFKKYVLPSISLIFIISLYLMFFNIDEINAYLDNFKFLSYRSKEYKKSFYIGEKLLRFYYIQNKRPQIPKYLVKDNFVAKWVENIEDQEDTYYIDSDLPEHYDTIFKEDIAKKTGFNISDNAIKQFYTDGGMFYEFELKNPVFTRLYDKDFILNKKFSVEDVNNEIINSYNLF